MKQYTPPRIYEFTSEQERKAFNLILRNTIDKKIKWTPGSIQEILKGNAKESRMLLYYGEKQIGFSIQNSSQYVFFNINKDQADMLQSLIKGRITAQIESAVKTIDGNDNYYLEEI